MQNRRNESVRIVLRISSQLQVCVQVHLATDSLLADEMWVLRAGSLIRLTQPCTAPSAGRSSH
eukprot:2064216-Rhodomonas_salina.1